MNVGIFLGGEPFQLWMQCFMAGARKMGIAVVDADLRITDLEIGHVIVPWQPRRHLIWYLVGLGARSLHAG